MHPSLLRRILGIGILAGLLIGTFEPLYLRMFTATGRAIRGQIAAIPYRKLPDLKPFLEAAADRIPPGAHVVFVTRLGPSGDRYAFSRAAYVLAGRRVVSGVDQRGALVPQRFTQAEFAVTYGTAPPSGFEVVWASAEGTVSRPGR